MYIPTQQERYSKVAWYTLLLCLVLPSGLVAWAYGEIDSLLWCACAFVLPMARALTATGASFGGAVMLSSVFYALFFFWLIKRCKWKPKTRLTLAVTWGMCNALVLRLMIAYLLWRSIVGH